MDLNTLFAEAAERKASDIHLVAGQPPVFRIAGKLERHAETPALEAAALEALILPAIPEFTRIALAENSVPTAETTLTLEDSPLAFHLFAFREQGRLAATIRIISSEIPTLELVGGTSRPLMERIAAEPRGLVLFTGPTGCGKGTTAAAVMDTVNQSRRERIFVLEETAGYAYKSKESVVTTLRIGQDYDSYERAAQAILKGCDPDVVLFNDLPTLDAVRQALVLADTGHLVFAIMSAESAADALAQIAMSFPEPREAPLHLLARTLVAVFNQRLLRRADRPGRAAAYEVLLATEATREIIRRGASETELNAAIVAGQADGMRSLDGAIDALLTAGTITAETADLHRARTAASAAYPPQNE